MRLFITGASGLLGSNLSFIASSMGHTVLSAYNEHEISIPGCAMMKLDLLKPDFRQVERFGPDCLIHCAALTNVDLCETNRALAEQVNVGATRGVCALAQKLKCRMLFISTDSVFDGKKAYHKEGEKPFALNFYAQTKIDAERIVASGGDYAVIRTNFYGFNVQEKQSFSEWLYAKLSAGEKTPAFTDFFFSPIVANNLSEALLEIAGSKFCGTLHVAGKGRISKYDFALKFAGLFSLDRSLLVPKKMAELGSLKAARPSDCSLDVSKARSLLKTKLLGIEDGLRLYKKLFDEKYQRKLKGG